MSYEQYRQTNYKFYFIGVLVLIAVFYLMFQGGGRNIRGIDPFTGKKLLIVWESYSGDEDRLFREIAKKFEEIHPNIKVNVAQIPWMGQESKYRTSLIAGAPPDIGRVDTTFLPELVKNRVVEDLTPYVVEELGTDEITTFFNQYLPAAIDSCVFMEDGKKRVYGIPDQSNGVCLFYNKKHFREAGLDPEKSPKDWKEFLEYAKKLTDKSKNRFGVGLNNSLWWTFPFFNTWGAKFLSDDGKNCILNSKEGVEALQFKVDLYRKYGVEGGAWESGGINPEMGFSNGKYSMILMGPWNVSKFRGAKIDFGVGLIPEGPAGTATNVGGTDMVVFKKSANKKEAYMFLRFLTSREIQGMWANRLGQIPVNIEAYSLVDRKNNRIN